MATLIKTNKLQIKLNQQLFASTYDIFSVVTTQSHFKGGAYILDAPLMNRSVCSVLFTSGKQFYVLMKASKSNRTTLKDVLKGNSESEFISIQKIDLFEVDEYIIIQLLLNALGSLETSFLRFNNLTGHLYCFHPKWIRKGTNNGSSVIWKVPCLEISIDKDYYLHLDVRTFTSELLRKKILFTKKKFDDYPKYVLSAHNTLRRKLKDDGGPSFILRQTTTAKTEIPFLNIHSIDDFHQSKMGVLAEVVESFNSRYCDIAEIEFETIEIEDSVFHHRRDDLENQLVIKNYLASYPIRIVDEIQDKYSATFCNSVQTLLNEKYGIRASVGKRFSKKALNISVIHNDAYYIDREDPHDKRHEDISVQHITYEDFCESKEFAISTVVNELIIKNDLMKGEITLFDWTKCGFSEDFSFGISTEYKSEERFYFMTIHPNGSFNITETKNDLFTMDQYSELVNIFEEGKIRSQNIKGVIKTGDSIGVIKDTGWVTIPEIFKIKKELENNNTALRGKSMRSDLLTASLDIHAFKEDGIQYYYVNDIGEGMRWSIRHAANIRTLENYKGPKIDIETLLSLMNVVFVRNGQLTVIPFPFKYLREYIRKDYE